MAQLPQPEKKKISDHNHNHEPSSSSLITTAMMKENAKPPPTTPTVVAEISGCSTITGSSTTAAAVAASAPFKFNAQAPEFVPRSHSSSASATQQQVTPPISGYFYPCFHYLGAAGGSDWFFLGDQDAPSPAAAAAAAAYLISNPSMGALPSSASNKDSSFGLSDELRLKIVKQAEYQFSDMSLLANESMSKHLSKDPEGYVAISVIASTKKMKSLTSNHHLITQALKSSSKLVVNEDGRKVKRKIPFTEKDREELQSRTVVVENLPDDHSHQNLEKIFGVVGSVKTIRICHPQESNSSRSKSDFFMSNKLHALVEFEAPDVAEKAVEKLNDERNWRKGLRVRLLFRCSPKSVLKSRKSEFDGIMDDEEGPLSESLEDISIPSITDITSEPNPDETPGSSKKGGNTARGGRGPKGRGRLQSYGSGGRGLLLSPSTQTVSSSSPFEGGSSGKTYGGFNRGPRMPDGTRGFTMGRGKPLALASSAVAMVE
ncbi:La-related protein 6C [Linum perenne]